jgi:hypothetical protein
MRLVTHRRQGRSPGGFQKAGCLHGIRCRRRFLARAGPARCRMFRAPSGGGRKSGPASTRSRRADLHRHRRGCRQPGHQPPYGQEEADAVVAPQRPPSAAGPDPCSQRRPLRRLRLLVPRLRRTGLGAASREAHRPRSVRADLHQPRVVLSRPARRDTVLGSVPRPRFVPVQGRGFGGGAEGDPTRRVLRNDRRGRCPASRRSCGAGRDPGRAGLGNPPPTP